MNPEYRKQLVFAWLNKQIKAYNLNHTRLFENGIVHEIGYSFEPKKIMLFRGIKLISDITGIPYTESKWDGNAHCSTTYIERSIMYKGYKFYSISESYEEEDKENEEAEKSVE